MGLSTLSPQFQLRYLALRLQCIYSFSKSTCYPLWTQENRQHNGQKKKYKRRNNDLN